MTDIKTLKGLAKENMTDDEIYEIFSPALLEDTQQLIQENSDFKISYGDKNYNAKELAEEITNRTEFGMTQLRNFYYGIMVFKNKV